ncbi:MAG: DNA-3-methyladenine glycosylase [Candidatus Saccharimonas sp.]
MKFTAAEQSLISLDPTLGKLIQTNGSIHHTPRGDYFEALCESIISQQLSVKASDTIFGRFRDITELQPSRVLALDELQQKTIGLSGQKLRYLHDLAEHFVRDATVFDHLDALSDASVIEELTKVKGIGVWTAQMFLMFTLTRPDIFAPDDLGLLNAMKKAYGLSVRPTKQEALLLAEKWAPYRSTACFHLWRSLDNSPVSN